MERRTIQRFQLQLPANLVADIGRDTPVTVEMMTRDISSSGAFCCGEADFPVGMPLNCQISLQPNNNSPGKNGVIYVDGVVVRAETDGVAIKFDSRHTIVSRAS